MPAAPEAKKRMLEAFLPSDEPVYFALLEQPDSSKEITDANYSRVPFQSWETLADGSARLNVESVEWPAMLGPVTARGVGVFTAAVGGQLLVAVPTRSLLGVEAELILAAGDVPRLPPGSIRIQIV